jgi:sugar phosphate isomerase/epimerase
MIFNNAYYNSMDRGYYTKLAPGEGPAEQGPQDEAAIGLSPKDIGISAPPMQDQLQALKAKIFQGASRVELGFMGRGKGSMAQGSTTPEMYGREERIDIRELAQLNEVQLTTHATPSAGSLAGLSEQGFDESARERALHEVERAVDFAADVTSGGAVVVHANEYPRPILESFPEFQAYPEEKNKAVLHVVDKRTGQMIPVRKDMVLYEPKYETKIINGKEYWVDILGNPIDKTEKDFAKLFNRVPVWKKEGTDFETIRVEWKDFEKRAEEWNAAHQNEKKITPEEMWYRTQIQNQILQAKGGSLFHAMQYEDVKERYEKIEKALTFYKDLKSRIPEDELWKIKQTTGQFAHFVPAEVEDPVDYLEKESRKARNHLRMIHEYSASSDVMAENAAEQLKQAMTIKDYATDKTSDTVARAAIYALEREKIMKEAREGQKMEKPLFISVETMFPEQYGGHPSEVMDAVLKARDKMVEKIKGQYGEDKARELAEQHIKATWDTGHVNIWRKYFIEQPGETIEQTDKRFQEWYLKEVDKWRAKKIMGHIHVSDNLGWDDEHVTPGEGNAPIKEFMAKMKKDVEKGDVDLIVEPGHQDYRALIGGWKVFGSSIYGLSAGRRDSWSDIHSSYFGRTAPPYFLYGGGAPDPESWQLWSGVTLE